jgi:hypothetical protein
MVSFNLVRKMIEYVKLRRLTPKEAARIMAKCCECGVFNPARAEALLERIQKKGSLSLESRVEVPLRAIPEQPIPEEVF